MSISGVSILVYKGSRCHQSHFKVDCLDLDPDLDLDLVTDVK